MKYLAAYALLSLSGKKDISAADIKNVLGSAGANVSDADLNRLIQSLKGKDINKLIASGATKLGAAGSSTASTGKASKPVQQKKKQQPKKQVKKVQAPKQQEQDFGLGGGLFD